MSFDGRYYTGAAPLPPILHHPHAYAVGELASGALVAGYFTSIHQATLIGSQTYAMRRRRRGSPRNIQASTWVRLAEWCAVHLPEHVTHLAAHVWLGTSAGPSGVLARARIVAEWTGPGTVTGAALVAEPADVEPEFVAGLECYRLTPSLALPVDSRPTTEARVYVEGYANNADGPLDLTPLEVSVWRVTR